MNYYNENDPKAAAWLRELVAGGHIPSGRVDERSICDVRPADLAGYVQSHFFAGIGGWSLALQLAGWPADRPVWTGSCPCQPFSAAGKGKGAADERHLWPVFRDLIRECRPEYVFGEQVANAVGHGWLDGVSTDMEAEGYAVGAVVLGAHSVGAPHIRQRLYWVAHTNSKQDLAPNTGGLHAEPASGGTAGGLVNAFQSRLEGHAGNGDDRDQPGRIGADQIGPVAQAGSAGAWSDFYLVHCADGKTRRIGAGIQPLAHGVPGRVGLLRGYGNAIVPQVAAEFVKALTEVI